MSKKKSQPSLIEAMSTSLLFAGDNGLMQKEVFAQFGSGELRTIVSRLIVKHGIIVHKKDEPIVNRIGTISRYKRYSVTQSEHRAKLIELINHWRNERNAKPIEFRD